jgi:ANTAR domain
LIVVASGDAETRAGADGADLWDAAADERQRLAEEREQLSNERESLADERERLADENERLLDQRYATLSEDVRLGAALDDEFARVEAEGNLERAEARLQRAVAERARAQVALERQEMNVERHSADAERTADRGGSADDDDERWQLDRRGFVAVERERLATLRDTAQDARDELAATRERDADRRDHDARDREQNATLRETQQLRGAATTTAHQQVVRARSDLSQVREAADRQRRGSARLRQRAAVDRAEASGRAASFIPDAYGPRLRAEFMDLTRNMFASQQLSDVADRALRFGLECLPDYVAAGVTIVQGGLSTVRIATDPVAEKLDALQIESGQGPTFEALGSPEPVHAASFAAWPDLAVVTTELGVEGALAYGLSVPRDGTWHPLGTLTFYADAASALDHDVVDLGSIIAAYLAVAAELDRDRTDLSRREAALHRALSSRDVIGQAKGMLMERQHIPAGEAFDILRRTSQRLNLRLQEVAAQLAETGEVPQRPS